MPVLLFYIVLHRYPTIFLIHLHLIAESQPTFESASMERQTEYVSLLRETNGLLRSISTALNNFVNVYAAVHNVEIVSEEDASHLQEQA